MAEKAKLNEAHTKSKPCNHPLALRETRLDREQDDIHSLKFLIILNTVFFFFGQTEIILNTVSTRSRSTVRQGCVHGNNPSIISPKKTLPVRVHGNNVRKYIIMHGNNLNIINKKKTLPGCVHENNLHIITKKKRKF